jgi:hypothetical protein
MNKIVATIAMLLFTAASAFAAGTPNTQVDFADNGTTTMGTPSMSLKPSKNVTVSYQSSVTQAQSGTNLLPGVVAYSISSSHATGSKSFGSSSGDTKIFMKDGTGVSPETAPVKAGDSASGYQATGWTAM